jgi:hypothetical protein
VLGGGVTYTDVDSDWKLDLFASLTTTTNYNKSSTVITAYITLKACLIFTLREPVFLPTSRLPWPMPEVLASADSSSIFNSLYKSRCNSNCGYEDYEEREKWVVVRDTPGGGGNRIYNRI